MIPVHTLSFTFPKDDYLKNVFPKLWLGEAGPGFPSTDALWAFFKCHAEKVSMIASDLILNAQVEYMECCVYCSKDLNSHTMYKNQNSWLVWQTAIENLSTERKNLVEKREYLPGC